MNPEILQMLLQIPQIRDAVLGSIEGPKPELATPSVIRGPHGWGNLPRSVEPVAEGAAAQQSPIMGALQNPAIQELIMSQLQQEEQPMLQPPGLAMPNYQGLIPYSPPQVQPRGLLG